MTTQPQRVHLSIASPLEIESTARQLMAIRENFLCTGSLLSWSPRPLIFDSWQRCLSLHVNPSRRCATLAVTREAQLHQLRESNGLLMLGAQPVMEHLNDFLSNSGYVVVLSDAQGRLLNVIGDTKIRRRLSRIDFVPGANWSEAAAGTNAIGTALADGHVVQLMAAEHYCDGWQDLTCTASPIRHPFTNEVIGILDVTGDYRLIRPFLTSFLASAALEIRQNLQLLLSASSDQAWRLYYDQPVASLLDKTRISDSNAGEALAVKSNDGSIVSRMPVNDIQWQLNRQKRRANDAERLAATASIISSSLDLNVTLEKIVEQAAFLLQVERAGVLLFDENDEISSMYVWSRLLFPSRLELPHMLVELWKEARIVALVRERGEPVAIDNILHSTLLPPQFIEQTGIQAMMLLPLVTARGINGFLAAARPMPFAWSVEDMRLGLAFATHSATAIENARLFDAQQQRNRQIETLNAIAHILSTLPDPGRHLDLVLERIAEIINVDAGMILLLNQTNNHLVMAAQCKLANEIQLNLETFPLCTLQILAHRAIALREPLMMRLEDCEEPLLRQAMHLVGFCNLMVIPLTTSDAVLGVLFVSGNGPDESFREDLKFFSAIGQQLGLALRNAQLRRSANEMEALREADRLKSVFLAGVSHDLRSPLTAIRASVESLLDAHGVQSATSQDQLLSNIAGQANRLGQLVDQLLDLSRIEAGALSLDCDWVELAVLIEDAIKEFERLHRNCRIESSLETGLALLYIDPDRFTQVLWNLLENAYKYAPDGPAIQVGARLQDDTVLISVADRGPGIPRGEHEKVFQRFYRLDRDQQAHRQGSGLGLAICRGIVEAHGGCIWVESREEGGCVFLITLHLPAPESIGMEDSEGQELLV